MEVKREKVSTGQMQYRYNSALKAFNELSNELNDNIYIVIGLSNTAYELFYTSFLFETDKDKIKKYLRACVEISLAKFLMATHTGNNISFTINGTDFQIIPETKNYETSIIKWMNLFYAAYL